MNDVKRQQVADLIREGVSQAEAARRVGLDKSTVHRWVKAGLPAQVAQPAQDLQSEATTGLADLVPQALKLLEEALSGGSVPAVKARVALDIVKAAASVGIVGGREGDLAKRVAEASGAELQSD